MEDSILETIGETRMGKKRTGVNVIKRGERESKTAESGQEEKEEQEVEEAP